MGETLSAQFVTVEMWGDVEVEVEGGDDREAGPEKVSLVKGAHLGNIPAS